MKRGLLGGKQCFTELGSIIEVEQVADDWEPRLREIRQSDRASDEPN